MALKGVESFVTRRVLIVAVVYFGKWPPSLNFLKRFSTRFHACPSHRFRMIIMSGFYFYLIRIGYFLLIEFISKWYRKNPKSKIQKSNEIISREFWLTFFDAVDDVG